jgi:hypothetical protein
MKGLAWVTIAAALVSTCSSTASAQARSSELVTLAVNPDQVCTTDRAGHYPNLDLIIDNAGSSERQIDEIRALVRDRVSQAILK